MSSFSTTAVPSSRPDVLPLERQQCFCPEPVELAGRRRHCYRCGRRTLQIKNAGWSEWTRRAYPPGRDDALAAELCRRGGIHCRWPDRRTVRHPKRHRARRHDPHRRYQFDERQLIGLCAKATRPLPTSSTRSMLLAASKASAAPNWNCCSPMNEPAGAHRRRGAPADHRGKGYSPRRDPAERANARHTPVLDEFKIQPCRSGRAAEIALSLFARLSLRPWLRPNHA